MSQAHSQNSAPHFPEQKGQPRASWRRERPSRGSAPAVAMAPGRSLKAPGRPVRACVRRHRLLALFCQLPCHIDRAHRWCVRAPAMGRDGRAMGRARPGRGRGAARGRRLVGSASASRQMMRRLTPASHLSGDRRRRQVLFSWSTHLGAPRPRRSCSRSSWLGRRQRPRPRHGQRISLMTAATTSPARRGRFRSRGSSRGSTS